MFVCVCLSQSLADSELTESESPSSGCVMITSSSPIEAKRSRILLPRLRLSNTMTTITATIEAAMMIISKTIGTDIPTATTAPDCDLAKNQNKNNMH